LRLPRSFYTHDDVVGIAQSLLGKTLSSLVDGVLTSGIITETEAYRGPEDKASHAFGGRRTPRTEVMYAEGGTAYIYLCYGIHHLFNVVTSGRNTPHAVLIRAIEPTDGLEVMLERRKMVKLLPRLTSGPGALSEALGLKTSMTGADLTDPSSPVWLEDRGVHVSPGEIIASARVGVGYAAEWAGEPWRFRIKGNPWTSPAK
jgi:DNA-3-methyladenine glycosylase